MGWRGAAPRFLVHNAPRAARRRLLGFAVHSPALALPVASPAMAAVPPSPRPLTAHGDGGDAPVCLFLDTDLSTHLALAVSPDTTIRRLKSQVATEHAAAFPDLGLVDVMSFQVCQKGVYYYLSESMTVTSACKKVKGGCFLHVKMSCSCQDALAIDRRRSSDGRLGIYVEKNVQELPATASDIASDMLPQSLEGGNDDAVLNNVQAHDASPNCILVPSSSQRNIEIKKNKVVGPASDTQAGFDRVIEKAKSYSGQIKHANQTKGAYISNNASMANVDKSSNQSNMSHAVEEPHARNMIENPIGDGKKKKRRKHHSESLKGVDPSQDMTKSSEFVTNECPVHCIDAASVDAKQTTLGNIEGATVIERNKQGESLDMAATNVIEVLADLRSNGSSRKEFCLRRSSRKDLARDLLTGQSHLPRNQNALQVPESTVDKVVGINAALPQKYPAAVHSDAPVSSLGHKKSKRKRPKGLSTMIDSSHPSTGIPEEHSNIELKDTDSLRFADKTSNPKDILTGDVVMQADDKLEATKCQRKKLFLKQTHGKLDLNEVKAKEANLVQEGSIIYTPLSTIGNVEQKDRPYETPILKVQETNCCTHGLDSHLTKGSQDEYVTDVTGTHDNENAAGTPTESHVAQKDAMALKSPNPNFHKKRKKPLNSEFQGYALEHGSSVGVVNSRSERGLVCLKISADAVTPNYHAAAHAASDEISVLYHLSCSKMNDDPSVSEDNKQNNEDETLREVKNKKKNKRKQSTDGIEPDDVVESLPTDKTSLTGHFGTSEALVLSGAAEDLNRENENAKNGKEKKRKRKSNMEISAAEKENPNCDNQGIDIFIQKSLISVELKRRMSQDDSAMQHELEDAAWNHNLEKILPDDVLSDILLRLPSVASLARAAMVSRSWRQLATSASFLHSFRSRHLSPPLLGCFVSLMKQDDTFDASHASHTFHPMQIYSDHDLTAAACGSDFHLMDLKEERHWRMTDCRGGFILLASRERFSLFDPVSRSRIYVSRPTQYNNSINPSSFHSCLLPACGAGDDTHFLSFRFLLVSIEETGSRVLAHVYNHGARKWHLHGFFKKYPCNIQAPARFLFLGRRKDRSSFPSMYAAGCVYWKYEEGKVLLSLATADGSMTFSHVALPPEPDLYREQAPFVVGEKEDGTCCLVCVVNCSRGYVLQVWLRNEEAQSWILDMDVKSSVMLACNDNLRLSKVRRVCAVTTGVVLLSLYHAPGQYRYMAFRLKDLYAAAALAEVGAPASLQLEADFYNCRGLEAYPYLMAWPPSSLVQ